MRRGTVVAALLAAGLALTACSSAAPAPAATPAATSAPTPGLQRDLVYRSVDGTDLALDAYLPAKPIARPTPAVLVVHGGGFTSGDKGGLDAAPAAARLAQAGYAAFSIDYRKVPSGAFPGALEDLQAAVSWLRQPEQAARFGIDPERIGAFGGSAGAILVAEAGTAGDGSSRESSRLRAVVALSGILDFPQDALPVGLPDAYLQIGLDYLGCTDTADCPSAVAASPLAAVDRTDPAFYVAHSVDEDLPEESAVAFAAALEAAGVPVQLDLRPGSAHSVLMLDGPMWERILAFYAEHL